MQRTMAVENWTVENRISGARAFAAPHTGTPSGRPLLTHRPEPPRELAMHRREAALDLYNAILGAFLAVSPWLFDYAYGPNRDGAFASGVLLTLMSLLAITAF